MATTRQLLRILRLSLFLNLIHFSTSMQIDSFHHSHQRVLCPEEVGVFNPNISSIHGPGPVVAIGSEMVYRDIHTWVEILNELANVHGPKEITQVIQPCLRGSAAIWWIAELTGEERKKLRKANLQRWSSALIERFELPYPIVLWRAYGWSYTTRDLDQHPRIWIRQMLQYAKTVDEPSETQLWYIWIRFDPALRLDIPEPTPTTRLIDFLERVDHVYPLWVMRSRGWMGGFPPPEFHHLGLSSVDLQLSGLLRHVANSSTS